MVLGRIIPGGIFIVLALVFLMETRNFPEKLGRDVGAAFWPYILISSLILFSIWLIITGVLNKKKGEAVEKINFNLTFAKLKPYIGMLACIAFVVLFKPFGFIVSTFAFYVVMALIMYSKFEWKFFSIVIVQGITLILAIFLVFEKFLSVSLPTGMLGF